MSPNRPIQSAHVIPKLFGASTPKDDAPPVAPRVAGSNPVAHPNQPIESTHPRTATWAHLGAESWPTSRPHPAVSSQLRDCKCRALFVGSQRSSVVRHRAHEIATPRMVRSLRPQPKARSIVQPQPASRPLFLRHFQSVAPPDPLHAILAHMPTAIPQQSGDPPVALAPVLAGQRHDLARQRIFVRSVHSLVALCPSPLPQQPAGMPLRYLVALACMPDRATPPLRA